MAEQHLDDADIGAGFEQVRGEAVAQRVNGDRLAQICLACPFETVGCPNCSSASMEMWAASSSRGSGRWEIAQRPP
jgi:hypothetical protein